MSRVHRTDFATTATGIEPTPQGGVRVRARVARVGVLRYSDASGRTWGEYRPPEEVFAEDSLATLRGATVTDLHPQGLVTAESYRELARGHAHDDVGAEDGRYVVASLAVNDASLARMVLDGERRDVSAGYTCEVEPTPGVSPEGEPYDGIQRRIRFNHVALGPRGWGRSGTDVGLRMDGAAFEVSAGSSAAVMETKSMKRTLKVRGVEYRLDGDNPEDDKVKQAISDMEAEMPKKDADNAALLAQLEAAQKALTEAVGEVAKHKAQMIAEHPAPVVTEEMVPEEVMDAALARREQLRADAAVILGDEAVKALKPAEIKRAALAKLSVKTDGLDAKLVDTLFTGAVAAAKATKPAERRTDSLDALNRIGNAPPSEHADSNPIEHMEKTTAARWQQPLMHSAAKGA